MGVILSEAGSVADAEAPVSSAGFEVQWKGIQLYVWDLWLNSETGREINQIFNVTLHCTI